jgi:hypothetical protein
LEAFPSQFQVYSEHIWLVSCSASRSEFCDIWSCFVNDVFLYGIELVFHSKILHKNKMNDEGKCCLLRIVKN